MRSGGEHRASAAAEGDYERSLFLVSGLQLVFTWSGHDVPTELDKANINFSCSCFLITVGKIEFL